MPELELLLDADSASQSEAFEVAFVDDDGEQRRELTAALSVPFESCHAVRRFASYKGQRDFKPCPYGFRPRRRAQDAIAEIHYLASPTQNYEWVFDADIAACLEEIDHTALMARVRGRISDKRVLG